MTKARKEQISLSDTPYYHCMVRCVRRAYLCGEDALTGKNFDHRKQWAVVRLRQLASLFAIDICAYAIMSNHYHVVLHVNQAKAAAWSEREVAERWSQLFTGNKVLNTWLAGGELDSSQKALIDAQLPEYRSRLCSISWFMRCMNETIARKANAEDDCTGRFWEGRFKSQPLLDEVALLSCMTYVDLNPIRAKMAESIEASDFTSVQRRLLEYAKAHHVNDTSDTQITTIQERITKQEKALPESLLGSFPQSEIPQAPLMQLDGSSSTPFDIAIPFAEIDYLELVDKTARIIREDKRGFVATEVPDLLSRFGLQSENWIHCIKRYGSMFSVAVGRKEKLKQYAEACQKQWVKGASTDAFDRAA